MNLPSLISKALAKQGQFTGFLWNRPAKVRKGCAVEITKEVRCVARVGVDHEHRAKVQAARESGELPSENQGLPWGQWLLFPYLITHKGKLYLRIYPVEGRRPHVIYRMNGQIVSKEEIKQFCLASEFSEVNEQIGCMTLSVEHLKQVK